MYILRWIVAQNIHMQEAFRVQTKCTTRSRAKQARIRPRRSLGQRQERLFAREQRPVFRNPRVRMEADHRGEITPYGGLATAVLLAKKLRLDEAVEKALGLLEFHLPYGESDHVLTEAYNLFVGGNCLQDIENLQRSKAVQTLLGSERIPDPTTAGDFLRRFGPLDLKGLQAAIDAARVKVWKKMPRRLRRTATIDIDSHIKEVYGECKQGADFSYTKRWAYHPLLVTLQETGECLRSINRPGNAVSADGAVETLREVFDLARGRFGRLFLRGDSKFCQREIVTLCNDPRYAVGFALVKEVSPNVQNMAENLPEEAWRPYIPRPDKLVPPPSGKPRRRRTRHRRKIAQARGYRNLDTVQEWLAEVPYSLTKCAGLFRMVIKRQLIEERHGQKAFVRRHLYRFILSNIPSSEMTPEEVMRFAYGRCDQENAIEQAKNGLNGFRMPTGSLLANAAYLLCAQIAWNLRAWLSLIALPSESRPWEWKRFRHAFVYVAAKIVSVAREAVVRISAYHRWARPLIRAVNRLRRMPFL